MATCDKTGLEFEAATKRTKNHPAIMNVLNAASRDGWHREAMAFLEESRGRFETIEAYLEGLEQVRIAKDAQVLARVRAEREAKEERQRAYVARREQNNFLNANGYRWHKDIADEEDADLYGARDSWYLTAPDGRAVGLGQAMMELAFYQDAAYAKEWLKSRGVAEKIPEIEKERRTKEEAARIQAQQDAVAQAALNTEQQCYFSEAKVALVEAGLDDDKATHEALRLSQPHRPTEDIVALGPLTLPDCHAMLVINGDFRYGVMISQIWHGFEEIEEMYPDQGLPVYFAPYKARNEARRTADLAAIEASKECQR